MTGQQQTQQTVMAEQDVELGVLSGVMDRLGQMGAATPAEPAPPPRAALASFAHRARRPRHLPRYIRQAA